MSDSRILSLYSKKYGWKEVIVDADKYDLAMSVPSTWYPKFQNKKVFYVARNLLACEGRRYKGEKEMLHHRVFMKPPPGMVVDFVNHNGLDCRLENLRLATPKDDQGNREKIYSSTSPYKGVTWDPRRKRWKARLYINGKRTLLGFFTTPEAAAHAYNTAAQEYFHEFALTNEVSTPYQESDRVVAPRKTSQYRGVSWNRDHHLWVARINMHGKTKYLGSFPTQEEAALAYNAAAQEYFGEFALLNDVA
jgi:hypothetical protein